MKETHDDLSDLNVTQQESLGEWETQFTRESKHFHVLSKKKKKKKFTLHVCVGFHVVNILAFSWQTNTITSANS